MQSIAYCVCLPVSYGPSRPSNGCHFDLINVDIHFYSSTFLNTLIENIRLKVGPVCLRNCLKISNQKHRYDDDMRCEIQPLR